MELINQKRHRAEEGKKVIHTRRSVSEDSPPWQALPTFQFEHAVGAC
jgi:hypothetical protein